MTPKDKELLLQDLCSRLPYGVMVLVDIDKEFDGGYVSKLTTITEIKGEKMFLTKNSLTPVTIEEIRPYLRPMSSMTEEEEIIYEQLIKDVHYKPRPSTCCKLISWLKENYFDYNYLIDKGLAIEAPKGMYDIKEK